MPNIWVLVLAFYMWNLCFASESSIVAPFHMGSIIQC